MRLHFDWVIPIIFTLAWQLEQYMGVFAPQYKKSLHFFIFLQNQKNQKKLIYIFPNISCLKGRYKIVLYLIWNLEISIIYAIFLKNYCKSCYGPKCLCHFFRDNFYSLSKSFQYRSMLKRVWPSSSIWRANCILWEA